MSFILLFFLKSSLTTLGLEPVSIMHYTRPGSSIKPKKLATQCHGNWPVIYPESSYKIIDPVSAALPQNLRRIFVATLHYTAGHPVFLVSLIHSIMGVQHKHTKNDGVFIINETDNVIFQSHVAPCNRHDYTVCVAITKICHK